MAYSIALRDAVLAAFRGTALTIPGTLYVALLTTNPTDETGTGAVEVGTGAWTNYARQSVVSTPVGWNAPAGGTATPQSITNKLVLDYGTATTTGNVTVTGFAVYDAASGGTFYGWNTLKDPSGNPINPIVQNGNPVSVAAGALSISQ